MNKKLVIWLASLIIVNAGWIIISEQSATQEINRPGADFSAEREAEFSSFQGDSVDVEVEHCFSSSNGQTYDVSITIEQGGNEVYSWEGTTDDSCVTWQSNQQVGKVTFFTVADEQVEVTTTLSTKPMANSFSLGILVFSLSTVVIAYGETMVRGLIRNRLDAKKSKVDNVVIHSVEEVHNEGIWQEPVRPN